MLPSNSSASIYLRTNREVLEEIVQLPLQVYNDKLPNQLPHQKNSTRNNKRPERKAKETINEGNINNAGGNIELVEIEEEEEAQQLCTVLTF